MAKDFGLSKQIFGLDDIIINKNLFFPFSLYK
jgi:hypothetical protein